MSSARLRNTFTIFLAKRFKLPFFLSQLIPHPTVLQSAPLSIAPQIDRQTDTIHYGVLRISTTRLRQCYAATNHATRTRATKSATWFYELLFVSEIALHTFTGMLLTMLFYLFATFRWRCNHGLLQSW